MHARYYNPGAGRFLSVDPLMNTKRAAGHPQAWNRYAYVLNNPMRLFDPTGKYDVDCTNGSKREQARCNTAAEQFNNQRKHDLASTELSVRNAAAAWGTPNDHNGVSLTFRSQSQVNLDAGRSDGDSKGFVTHQGSKDGIVNIHAEFVYSMSDGRMAQMVAHEGSHIADRIAFLKSFDPATKTYSAALNYTNFDTEFKAYQTGSLVSRYPDFKNGPQGYQALTVFIKKYYPDAEDLLFDPRGFPTR
jgi:hypothetical protein